MPEQYYDRRAWEYEEVYHRDDPVRQREQVALAGAVKEAVRNRCVLEVACGTGYWTAHIAEVARHVVAVDLSPEMLAIARAKGLAAEKVEFCQGDAYALESVPTAAQGGAFDAGVANFWFSHVPQSRLDQFLNGFHSRLGAGVIVFMADNVYVPGIGGKLVTRPGAEDTFKIRQLSDGSTYEVLKNYYGAAELLRILSPRTRDLRIRIGPCFWWVMYEVS